MANVTRMAMVTLDPKKTIEDYLLARAMRNNKTITAAAVRRIWRSRCVGAGTEPGHRERAGRLTGSNTDHDVPRLVVADEPPLPEDVPVTVRRTVR
ncbi:MAG: hypothetical protein NTX94_06345 [Caldiserica bacterium]|nr:hypothetical protein [Caldisericota bacterium]